MTTSSTAPSAVAETVPPPAMLAFDTEVVAVARRTPSTVRVTLGGDCLRHFDGGGNLGPRDLRVKLMLPAPGNSLPDLSDLSHGWYAQWLAVPTERRGWMRTYTVRAARITADAPQIDIDFVLHQDSSGHSGPGSAWAAQAQPGQRLTVIGPRTGSGTYGGVEWRPPAPGGSDPPRVLLAGDETAVPAIASILETMPGAHTGRVVLEVTDAAEFDHLRAPAGVEVLWLARNGRSRGELLRQALAEAVSTLGDSCRADGSLAHAAALEEVDVDAEILWETGPAAKAERATGCYAWIAGEAAMVKDLRRLLVRDLGFDRSQMAFMGYWRDGRAES
jgi:NADPH-dependent ferric siderophore reductase